MPDLSENITADSLHQLLLTPVVNGAPALPEGDSLRQISIPDVHVLAADSLRYTMLVSDDDQLVWIQKAGGIGNHINDISGPWSIRNQHLVAIRSQIAERETAVRKNRSNEN